MNILIDCITLLCKNGAAEYQRRVIIELLSQKTDHRLIGLYDSKKGIAYNDMQPQELTKRGMQMVDIASSNLVTIISSYQIDRFYIGCVQILADYKEVENIHCEVICVVHDLSFEEKEREDLDIYLHAQNKPYYKLLYWLLFKIRHDRGNYYIQPIVNLTRSNPKVSLIAVSEYTKYSLIYTYNIPKERITVLYSPERIYEESDQECNQEIDKLIESDTPFFMMLGTQHHLKNTRKAMHAFARFSRFHPEYVLITAGRKVEPVCSQHLPMGFLNEYELHRLYQSCHALIYPTLFEGFGYPPLEAMHYGKPVLASNIGPVREVFEDAPIYFSPLYETDIFQALNKLCEMPYSEISQRSKEQYNKVSSIQQNDLRALVEKILK